MVVYFRKRLPVQQYKATQNIDKNKIELCPRCGHESKMIENHSDREIYKCSYCRSHNTFEVPKDPGAKKIKKQKEEKSNVIVVRDRSKEVEKEEPQKEVKPEIPVEQEKILPTIQEAMKKSSLLKIQYVSESSGKETVRRIEPYKLTIDKNGRVVLFAYCLEGGGIRAFKVNGIKTLIDLKEGYKPRWEVEDQLGDKENRTGD